MTETPPSTVALATLVQSHAQVRTAFERLAAAVTDTAAAWDRLAASLGARGVAELHAYERRAGRYERHRHPAQRRRPYRHGRVGVR